MEAITIRNMEYVYACWGDAALLLGVLLLDVLLWRSASPGSFGPDVRESPFCDVTGLK